MNQIFDRIMTGETVCPAEVNRHNAQRIMDWVRTPETHHAANECRRGKNCAHAPTGMEIDWAATIVNESNHICTCGEHGVDNPEEAANIIAEFRTRWT